MTAEVIEAPEAELTEFEEIDVQKVSGVAKPANGTMHLILKGIPVTDEEPEDDDAAKAKNPGCGCCPDCTMDTAKAVVNGKVDQKPDIALGDKILTLLGQAMGNESQEVAAGHHGEAGDVSMLAQAHSLVHAWHNGEKTHPDGIKSAITVSAGGDAATDALVAHVQAAVREDAEKAKLTTEARNDLSDSDFALPGRHYPIHDENHARNALARVAENGTPEEKAKVRAAVHRKYPDIGSDDDGKSSKSIVAEQETTVDDVTQGTEVLTKSDLDAAVTKALETHKAELATLRDELAKVKATPIPGGPVLSANARPNGERPAVSDEQAAKAAKYEALSEQMSDPQLAAGYAKLARQARQEATPTT